MEALSNLSLLEYVCTRLLIAKKKNPVFLNERTDVMLPKQFTVKAPNNISQTFPPPISLPTLAPIITKTELLSHRIPTNTQRKTLPQLREENPRPERIKGENKNKQVGCRVRKRKTSLMPLSHLQ
jgi:hypothetical protein